MTAQTLEQYANITDKGKQCLREAMNRLDLSARVYERILKVSRTIADLESNPEVNHYHIAEAISYRNLDRGNWGE